jgi:hypothetical protein
MNDFSINYYTVYDVEPSLRFIFLFRLYSNLSPKNIVFWDAHSRQLGATKRRFTPGVRRRFQKLEFRLWRAVVVVRLISTKSKAGGSHLQDIAFVSYPIHGKIGFLFWNWLCLFLFLCGLSERMLPYTPWFGACIGPLRTPGPVVMVVATATFSSTTGTAQPKENKYGEIDCSSCHDGTFFNAS